MTRKAEATVVAETVVIIDDDEAVREALEGLLDSVGLQVKSYGSVQQYVDERPAIDVGCMVLDVRLPGRSGLDFQAELARSGNSLPVIFISGHADVQMSVRAMKAGAFEFLTKPVHHQELLDAIHAAEAIVVHCPLFAETVIALPDPSARSEVAPTVGLFVYVASRPLPEESAAVVPEVSSSFQ